MSGKALEIGGAVYTFEMTIDAMEQLEDLFSTPEREVTFYEILRKVVEGRAKYFRRFIWAALQKHHPGTSLTEAGHIIDAAGGMYALDALLGRLAEHTTPDPADVAAVGGGKTANPRKAQAGRRVATSPSPRVASA